MLFLRKDYWKIALIEEKVSMTVDPFDIIHFWSVLIHSIDYALHRLDIRELLPEEIFFSHLRLSALSKDFIYLFNQLIVFKYLLYYLNCHILINTYPQKLTNFLSYGVLTYPFLYNF